MAATDPDAAITARVSIAKKIMLSMIGADPVNQLGCRWQYGQ